MFQPASISHPSPSPPFLRALLLTSFLLAGARADPATTRSADLSDPRRTLAAAYSAMRTGDTRTLLACFTFADKQEEELAAITLGQKWAPRRVLAAAVQKWGEDARKIFGGSSQEKDLDDSLARVVAAEITVDGDTATVGKKRETNPNAETELTGVTLKKIGADWKIVAATFSDLGADVRAREMSLMKSVHDATLAACAQTAADISAGKFATAQEAYDAYSARLQQAVRAATTQRN